MFLKALETATATLGDVAKGTRIAYRTIHALKLGSRSVTPTAARRLVRYLRRRSKELARAADRLEASIKKGGRRG